MKFSWALVAALAAAPSQVDAGACAPPQTRNLMLTPTDSELAGDDVVALMDNPAKEPAAWKVDGHAVKPVEIAPGLVTVHVATSTSWASIVDDQGKPVVRVKRAKTPPAELAEPAAPAVKRSVTQGRRGSSIFTVVSVKSVPTNAVALVIYDAKQKPLSFGQVVKGSNDITVYSSYSCGQMSAGEVDTAAGDKVELAWVDASGRVSKHAGATVVAAK